MADNLDNDGWSDENEPMAARSLQVRRAPRLRLADESAVRRIAGIIGPCSAADSALAELDARRRDGESVSIYQAGSFWVVGPTEAGERKA